MGTRRLKRLLGRTGLYLVTGALFLSGLIRVVGSAGEAIAQAGIEPLAPAETAVAMNEGSAPKGVDISSHNPEGLAVLLERLKEREMTVSQREEALEQRLADLKIAEAALVENLEVLEMAEQRLKETLAQADGAQEGDIAHLTKVYETMKPKDAATLFEQMDPKFAAGFLARMTPAAASNVMAGLSPEAAYAISLIFAGRHNEVPVD